MKYLFWHVKSNCIVSFYIKLEILPYFEIVVEAKISQNGHV